jgi:hypothetical protein
MQLVLDTWVDCEYREFFCCIRVRRAHGVIIPICDGVTPAAALFGLAPAQETRLNRVTH